MRGVDCYLSKKSENDENNPALIINRKRINESMGGNSEEGQETRKRIAVEPLSVSANNQHNQEITLNTSKDPHENKNENTSDKTIHSLHEKIEQLSDKIDTFVSTFSTMLATNTMDLVNELDKEKEKVNILTKYTKECVDINDQLTEENESLKKENNQLKSEVKEYALLYRCLKDCE